MVVREVHAVCGTLMIMVAVLVATLGEGGWGPIGLFVIGLFVLLSSYDRGERRAGRQ